ncbi:MAG TPA: hypothetical protein VF646_14575, partial [Cytophagales bacterium]
MTTTEDKLRQSRRRRNAGLFLLGLLVVSFAGYVLLGGLKEPVLSETRIPGYLLAGKEFRGKSTDGELGALFDQAKQLHVTGQLPGTLAAIYYKTKDAAKGRVHTFAGVIVKDSVAKLPAGFVYRAVPPGRAVRAEVLAHYLVAPAPGRVQEELAAFASQNGLKADTLVVEKYYSTR